jgi:hypothetical protein
MVTARELIVVLETFGFGTVTCPRPATGAMCIPTGGAPRYHSMRGRISVEACFGRFSRTSNSHPRSSRNFFSIDECMGQPNVGTGSGTLQKTNIPPAPFKGGAGGMAEIVGSSPATTAYSYYIATRGAWRAVYDGSKALAAEHGEADRRAAAARASHLERVAECEAKRYKCEKQS